VSKASNLPAIETALRKAGVLQSQVVEMSQGQKQSRFVAWTFQTPSEQQVWRQRWARKTEPKSRATKNRARIAPAQVFLLRLTC